MNLPLYVWCSGCNQVLTIDSSCENALDFSEELFTEAFRYDTFDPNYSINSMSRFGSYLYARNKWISESWEGNQIEFLNKEFKTNLLLMGVLNEN